MDEDLLGEYDRIIKPLAPRLHVLGKKTEQGNEVEDNELANIKEAVRETLGLTSATEIVLNTDYNGDGLAKGVLSGKIDTKDGERDYIYFVLHPDGKLRLDERMDVVRGQVSELISELTTTPEAPVFNKIFRGITQDGKEIEIQRIDNLSAKKLLPKITRSNQQLLWRILVDGKPFEVTQYIQFRGSGTQFSTILDGEETHILLPQISSKEPEVNGEEFAEYYNESEK